MKKKVIEGARKLIKKLFEAILDREAFIFEAPKAFTRNFSRDMLTDDQLEVIDSWKAAVRGQLNTAESCTPTSADWLTTAILISRCCRCRRPTSSSCATSA